MRPLSRATLARVIKRGPIRRAGSAVRRAIAPERDMLVTEVSRLSDRIVALRQDHESSLRTLRDDQRKINELVGQVVDLQRGLAEARRLNLRVAELTDVMTELVLPLHDRDIDIERLAPLSEETL